MFQKSTATGYHPVLDKIRQKTLVFGAHTLLTEFRLEQGATLPAHSPSGSRAADSLFEFWSFCPLAALRLPGLAPGLGRRRRPPPVGAGMPRLKAGDLCKTWKGPAEHPPGLRRAGQGCLRRYCTTQEERGRLSRADGLAVDKPRGSFDSVS